MSMEALLPGLAKPEFVFTMVLLIWSAYDSAQRPLERIGTGPVHPLPEVFWSRLSSQRNNIASM